MAGGDTTINIPKLKGKGDYKLWRTKILLILDKENVSSIFDDELTKPAVSIQIPGEQNTTFVLKVVTHLQSIIWKTWSTANKKARGNIRFIIFDENLHFIQDTEDALEI